MDTKNSLNTVELIRDQLACRIRVVLSEDLLDKHVEEYRARIKPIIEEHVNMLSFDEIVSHRDLATMRDEFKVYLEWRVVSE